MKTIKEARIKVVNDRGTIKVVGNIFTGTSMKGFSLPITKRRK
jgi:hypothetical protein